MVILLHPKRQTNNPTVSSSKQNRTVRNKQLKSIAITDYQELHMPLTLELKKE